MIATLGGKRFDIFRVFSLHGKKVKLGKFKDVLVEHYLSVV